MPGKYWNAVMDVAVEQGGYVTPALVPDVPPVELRKMASRGTLERVGHGVYRVPALPREPFDEFILARLFTRGRGVISHDSALLIHQLCDINPAHVHLTVPRAYRINRSGGEMYVVHRADLRRDEVTQIEAVVVTTIRRTLTDALSTVPIALVRQAITTAAERGAIRVDEREALLAQLTT
ncbi:type IV toxin-antitoxin system AbiEi family antitoxin domain-containing protein [Phytoactinopolyspora halotolerans]|uniref:AbiEi antitoxin N-terminal domain-containing protein n=1 Tax=Phytoactinopolyspora halotolerans TaxID=1981512 RepID=A0A6L9SAV9_9ACTN|nr:type IV toxin-antitoxin system AbiEi family antitoxin domain-containing protein [Phytoactinopolyspora halotolerans]NEE02396.1 hypothetical protein [Phytoactinopolyspora halotolerans]